MFSNFFISSQKIFLAPPARHPARLEIIEREGIRSIVAVPLIKDGKAIGCLDIYRQEVKPFTEDEVALVQSFAA